MEDHETPHGDFFRELLIGGELGALAGIFFAPNSGKQPRSDIKRMGSEVTFIDVGLEFADDIVDLPAMALPINHRRSLLDVGCRRKPTTAT